MKVSNRLTFIGRNTITEHEKDLLLLFGMGLWRMGVALTIVPRGDGNEAVIQGVESKGGEVYKINNNALKAQRDGLVIYADPALLAAIAKAEPDLDLDKDAVVINNEEELSQYLEALLAAIWKEENGPQRTVQEAGSDP
jgi:hypothetical protein